MTVAVLTKYTENFHNPTLPAYHDQSVVASSQRKTTSVSQHAASQPMGLTLTQLPECHFLHSTRRNPSLYRMIQQFAIQLLVSLVLQFEISAGLSVCPFLHEVSLAVQCYVSYHWSLAEHKKRVRN